MSEYFACGLGKYIPSIGNAIWEGNKDEDFIINLQVCIYIAFLVHLLI